MNIKVEGNSDGLPQEITDFFASNDITLEQCEQVLEILGVTNLSIVDLPDFIEQLKTKVKTIVTKSEKKQDMIEVV